MLWSKYFREIEKALQCGNATEHTHRPALKELLEAVGKKITATNEPRREKCGAPDYVISSDTRHGPLTIGYVEAKDVGKRLYEVERSEQLTRYRTFLPNLILTDYLEFRWYVEGKPRGAARLGGVGKANKLRRHKDGPAAVMELLRGFLEHEPTPIGSPQELAQRLARLTHMIRDIIIEAIESGHASNTLRDLRKAFAQTLIPDLDQPEKIPDFADMYAQTIAYGLFAARCNHRGPRPFQRVGAAAEIPKTNPFLRRLFETITGADLDEEPYAGFVDDVAALLAHADMGAVLLHFGKRTRRQDPVVHFYETFLAAYDPKLREARGVYFTPEPVVSFIVRSVDHVLKTRFGCTQGLADTSVCKYTREGKKGKKVTETTPRVLILDPACGTGTFLYAVVDLIREQFMARNDAGMWSGYVKKHLLPRLFGFELLMAPYAVAHFKLGMQLAGQDLPSDALRKKWAYDFAGRERLSIYLTNTLEAAERRAQQDFHFIERLIAEEAAGAVRIKLDLPIMVVMGNPPYSGHSANKGEWITKLIADYRRVDGKKLKLAQAKWLQDDYVKFFRFGQWRIDRTGMGVLAFITNHSYLDSPTFQGMRRHAMQAFTEIYILDLHGNTKKKEVCPDGSKDENVFDIQQGVTIGVFVKDGKQRKGPATVQHAELWGLREDKYRHLAEMEIASTPWKRLHPQTPFFLFTPQNTRGQAEYELGWSIRDVMNQNGNPAPGIVTTQDQFAISWDAEEAAAKIQRFLNTYSEEEARELWRLCSQSQWSYERAKKHLRRSSWRKLIEPILYRPFDVRSTVYDSNVAVHRRERVMSHMMVGENVGLITSRLTKGEKFRHCHCTRNIVEVICLSPKTSNNAFVFPLYLYPNPEKDGELFANGTDRHVNLNPDFLKELGERLRMAFVPDGKGDLKKTFGPEDVFHYIYAVFHSPTYRDRYSEFLKSDFPRVPLTGDRKLFRSLCSRGKDLVAFHLLESPKCSGFITRYPVPGNNLVAKGHPRYLAPGEPKPGTRKPLKKARVYISPDAPRSGTKGQYFEGVPSEVWDFQIGGYQVCEKWLKDRRGRNLSYDDLTHYQKLVVALKETIRLMEEIDGAIPDWPIS